MLWGSRPLLQQLQHMPIERTLSSPPRLCPSTDSGPSNPARRLDPPLQPPCPALSLLPPHQPNHSIISLYVCRVPLNSHFLWLLVDLWGNQCNSVLIRRPQDSHRSILEGLWNRLQSIYFPCVPGVVISLVKIPFQPGLTSHAETQMPSGDSKIHLHIYIVFCERVMFL